MTTRTDDELLQIVKDERARSVGFGQGDGAELQKAREKALKYYQGEMPDVPALDNRSKAVSTDIAEAIETVLPDIIEIFVGGDDVAAFKPVGPEDEQAAQQETDYTNHVVFNENPGFLVMYAAFKDALLCRTGLFKWWWEGGETHEDETFEGKGENELALAMGEEGVEVLDLTQNDDGTLNFTLRRTRNTGHVCVKAVPPEDFTVAQDTVILGEATYCAMRDRPRAQDLIARGVDRKVVEDLPAFGTPDDQTAQARDTAGEDDFSRSGGKGDLRIVEVVEHYVRLENDGELEVWRVVTGANEGKLIEKEKVNAIPFGALTPYINSHRFYGESVADKLLQVQQIKTALLRMLLDSGYFALNQRMLVAEAGSNEWTIPDLLRNEPNVPVRTLTLDAVKPLTAGGLNFDALAAIEHISTMGEARTGIVRNAQGLKPDTLHDTAKGAMALMTAAQKRVRLIARIFAETGVKDLFLGVHALIRQNATGPAKARLRGKWVEVDPSQWAERNDMTIEVGLGASGRELDMQAADAIMTVQEKVVALQGGVTGPFVTPQNVHAALELFTKAAGQKSPERYFSDPAEAEPQPPKPDPEMEKAKAELQIKQQEGQAKLQLQAQEGQQKAQLDAQQGERDYQLAVMKLEAEMGLKREQIAAELQLKREQLGAELALKRELGFAQAEVARETGMAKAKASGGGTSEVAVGGEPG